MNTYLSIWIVQLYTWNEPNIVNQLYFIFSEKVKINKNDKKESINRRVVRTEDIAVFSESFSWWRNGGAVEKWSSSQCSNWRDLWIDWK